MSDIHSAMDAPSGGVGQGLSFSSRLRWVLAGFLLAWLLFVGLFAWFFVRRSLFQQVDSVAINQLHSAAASLDDRLERLETLTESIARSLAVQWGPKPVAPPVAKALLETTLSSLTPEEAAVIYLAVEGVPSSNPEALIWFRRDKPPTRIIPGGLIRYDFHKESAVTNWYQKPKQTRKVFISEPYYDLGGSEQKVISVTAPVIDPQGVFRGVVGIDIRIEALEQVRRRLHLRPAEFDELHTPIHETGFICSPQGKIIAHPDSRLLPSPGNPEGVSVETLPMGPEILASPDGLLMEMIDNIPQRILWYTSIRTGWKLVFIVPETLLAAPVNVLALQLLAVFAAGSVVIIVLVSIIARKMAEPLEVLRMGALANSTQSPMVHALALRNDEIGLVSRWLLRLSEKATEQDNRNRIELMRAFRLELARQLADLKLGVGPEAIDWNEEQVARELQSQGYPVEPAQVKIPGRKLVYGENILNVQLSDDLAQSVSLIVSNT
jgi:hypothetical protein